MARNTLNVQEALRRAGVKFPGGIEFGTFLVPTVQMADLAGLVGEPIQPRAIAGVRNAGPVNSLRMLLSSGSTPALVEHIAVKEQGAAITSGDYNLLLQSSPAALPTAVTKQDIGDQVNLTERTVSSQDAATLAGGAQVFGGDDSQGFSAVNLTQRAVIYLPAGFGLLIGQQGTSAVRMAIIWRELPAEGPP